MIGTKGEIASVAGESLRTGADDEDEDEDEDDEDAALRRNKAKFTEAYPQLGGDARMVWMAYDNDSCHLDMTQAWVCNVVRDAWESCMTTAGRPGPGDSDLLGIMKEKREILKPEQTCQETYGYSQWDIQQVTGSKQNRVYE